MNARILHIEAKISKGALAMANEGATLNVFRYRAGDTIDARAILRQPNITLYCLDDENRQAVFTEAPAGVDVTREPFIYRGQYIHAQRLLTVDYRTLHMLADAVGDRFETFIPMYSVGRCGGTAMSRAMDRVDGVLSLDEPDVYNNLVLMRPRNRRRDVELVRLLRSCTRLLHHSASRRSKTVFVKLKPFSIHLGDLMHKAYPQSRSVFLYRNAEAWARSFGRSIQVLSEESEGTTGAAGSLNEFVRRLDLSRISAQAEQARSAPGKNGLNAWEIAKRATPLVPGYISRTLRRELGGGTLLRLGALAVGQKLPWIRDRWPTPGDYVKPYIDAIPSTKFLGLLWLSTMHGYLKMHHKGIPMLAVQYETLMSNNIRALEAIFEYCGLPQEQVMAAASAFAEDSQKDTPLARDRTRTKDLGGLTPDILLQLHEVLAEHPPTVTPDFVAPNSLVV